MDTFCNALKRENLTSFDCCVIRVSMSSNEPFPFLAISIGGLITTAGGVKCVGALVSLLPHKSIFMRSWQKALTLLSLLPLATQVVRGDATHMVKSIYTHTDYHSIKRVLMSGGIIVKQWLLYNRMLRCLEQRQHSRRSGCLH